MPIQQRLHAALEEHTFSRLADLVRAINAAKNIFVLVDATDYNIRVTKQEAIKFCRYHIDFIIVQLDQRRDNDYDIYLTGKP